MNLIDWFLNLFRDPVSAAAFVADPDRELVQAGFGNLSAAQVQAVAATVAPAAVLHGGGNPVVGLQQAVANTHGIAFVPQRQTDLLSGNETLSHNDTRLLSPETNNVVGHDGQQGVGNFDLEFGDITLGDKTTNTATDGGVVNTGTAGNIDATNVEGDGNVVGDDNENVNTGDIRDSNVNIGEDNEIDDSGDQTAGGDIISDNDGPVINDVDMSGGNGGGAAGGSGGGGLIGVGNDGGSAAGGAGGSGGGIVINDNDSQSTSTGGGDITTVDTGGGDLSGSVDASHDDNSVDNSVDNSGQDNSVDNSQTVDTDVNVSNDVGIF
ncbi:IniB N-terminal domain-containing protein [Mycobacterium sp. IDR2000157661]|uniref:IniB N-terminal domain-containing protein n=1 Tax=Mycobacterium sp. IDR2000157661 TaxID=2867005 RepID=UPI001EEBD795|nr:IniB N-terminal domain-containing protein [Mycobacterium sp. IDR2000157661]ULE34346.1 IniB N-terminal domain-containing protein [Mycobacterium sp. IDR2000157661]